MRIQDVDVIYPDSVVADHPDAWEPVQHGPVDVWVAVRVNAVDRCREVTRGLGPRQEFDVGPRESHDGLVQRAVCDHTEASHGKELL